MSAWLHMVRELAWRVEMRGALSDQPVQKLYASDGAEKQGDHPEFQLHRNELDLAPERLGRRLSISMSRPP